MRTIPGRSRHDCELCQEVDRAGTAATGRHRTHHARSFSRLIRRSPALDVYSGLGSIVPGYILIVPRRHVTSVGMLSPEEIRLVFDTARTMAAKVTKLFGHQGVIVEHGSSGDSRGPGRACIEHAHVHVFPVAADVDPRIFDLAGRERISGHEALSEAAFAGKNYYYRACGGNAMEGYFTEEPEISSQHARKVWSRAVGDPDAWDWALFPYLENCSTTTVAVSHDLPPRANGPGLAHLEETIEAYDQAADWYRDRTAAFQEDSLLRDEMRALAARTTGLILDAGAGGGRDSLFFSSLGRTVVALDAATALLLRVPRRPGILPMVADIRRLPFKDRTFGAIWCSAVLVHLDMSGLVIALQEFLRVLRPGGLVQISFKGGTGWEAQVVPGARPLNRYFFFHRADEVTDVARGLGFDLLGSWTEDALDSSGVKQQWVKLLLRRPAA